MTPQSPLLESVLRRDREHGVEVGPIELFFDLVYVFIIIQLSHHLLEHLTWRGLVETAVLFLAAWWAWNYSAWAMNWLDPDSSAVRVLLGVLMMLAFGMAVAIPHAFGEDAALFAGAYVLLQIIRSSFMVMAFRGRDRVMGRNYEQLLAWSGLASLFWIAGVFVSGNARVWLWAVGVVLDYAAPRVGFFVPGRGATPMESWTLRPAHLAERNRLVFIIALGETILVSGGLLSGLELTLPTVVAGVLGFVLLFCLWWNYFNPSVADDDLEVERATAAGRSAFAYAHAAMVAGAIGVAVGIEAVTAHPEGHIEVPVLAVTFVGPILYLLGTVWFRRSETGHLPIDRIWGAALLAGIAVAAYAARDSVSPVSALAVVTGLFVILAVTSTRRVSPTP